MGKKASSCDPFIRINLGPDQIIFPANSVYLSDVMGQSTMYVHVEIAHLFVGRQTYPSVLVDILHLDGICL